MANKTLKTDQEIMRLVISTKKSGKLVNTITGCFDVLHPGHYHLLRSASFGVNFVGINTDEYIRRNKGSGRPVFSVKERVDNLYKLPYVDYVFSFSQDTPTYILSLIKPDFHYVGDEYRGNCPEQKIVESVGGKVVFIKKLKGFSSTNIINRLRG